MVSGPAKLCRTFLRGHVLQALHTLCSPHPQSTSATEVSIKRKSSCTQEMRRRPLSAKINPQEALPASEDIHTWVRAEKSPASLPSPTRSSSSIASHGAA